MSIKKQFISGTIYVAVTKYSGIAIGLLITAILSRLLTPDDYGTVAIVGVLVVFFNLLGELGIGPSIIQKKDLTQRDINSVFSFTVLVGSVLATIFLSISPLISRFYGQPILRNLAVFFSANILFACVNIVPNAMLLKEKQFKFLMYRQLSVQLICGALGIAAALMNWGVYALLVHSVSSGVLTFGANYFHRPIHPAKVRMSSLRKIASYSLYQFLFGFINYFSRNLDKLLIGKFLSPAALGYYEKSYRLMLLPVGNLTHVLTPAIQPFFSEFQDDKQRIYNSYLKIVSLLALTGFPLSVFLHFAAPQLILLVFGDQWDASIPIFQILAWSVGIQMVLSSAGSIFQAANDTRRLFRAGFLSAILMTGGICAGIFCFNSLEAVAYALLCAFTINFFQCFYILIAQTLKQDLMPFFSRLFVPLLMAGITLIAEWLFSIYVKTDNPYILLGGKLIIFVIVFIPVAVRKSSPIEKII
jgi:PST family polysaccharide transporter